jgi:hypothetical protein
MQHSSHSLSSALTNDCRFQVNEDCPWHVLSRTGLGKEGAEGVITSHLLVRRHVSVRLDAMLEAVEFPAGIANLTTGLANVDRDAFTLK